jgi:hypothetical protein
LWELTQFRNLALSSYALHQLVTTNPSLLEVEAIPSRDQARLEPAADVQVMDVIVRVHNHEAEPLDWEHVVASFVDCRP